MELEYGSPDRQMAMNAVNLLRDENNNTIFQAIESGSIPEDIYLCVDGMGANAELHGNLPILRVPDINIPGQTTCSLQNLFHEEWVFVLPEGEPLKLTTQESYNKDPTMCQLLDFVLCWLLFPKQTAIHLIEDPDEKQAAWSKFWKTKDDGKFRGYVGINHE
jgi:hypothetical protein